MPLPKRRPTPTRLAKLLREEEISQSDRILIEARIEELSSGATKSLPIKEVAKRSGFEAGYRSYKRLSGEAAHASLQSLHRHMKREADGSYSGHVFGPDVEGIEGALTTACFGAQMCAAAFSTLLGGTPQDDDLHVLLARYGSMRPDEG